MGSRIVIVVALLLAGWIVPNSGAAAAEWSPATNLASMSSTGQVEPQLVMSSDGQKLAVAWVRRSGSTGILEVSRSADSGVTWGPVETVSAAVGDVISPRLVGSQDLSRLQVMWVQRGAVTHTIKTSTSVNGAVWTSATTAAEGLPLNDPTYAVAATPDATTVDIVWLQDAPGNYRMVKLRRTLNGLNQGAVSDVSTTPVKAAQPTIVSVNGGNWLGVAWIDEMTSPRAVKYRTRSAGIWSSVRLLSTGGNASQPRVAVSSVATTQAVIWTQTINGAQAVYVSTGGPELPVPLAAANSTDAQVIVAGDGSRKVAAWARGSGGAPAVRVSTGGAWGAVVVLPGPAGDQLQVVATANAMRLVAVWRAAGTSRLATAVSTDGGATWMSVNAPADTGIELPHVAISAGGGTFNAVWSRPVNASWFPRAAVGPPVLPAAHVSPTTVNFDQVTLGSTAPRSLMVRNTGLAPLTVSGITVAGDGFARDASNCLAVIQPAAACSITVVMRPASLGPASGELTIVDDASGSPRKVTLTGIGVEAVPPAPAKLAQVPRDRKGVPPPRIRKQGMTVLVGRNALTNAGQRISSKVTVKAKRQHYRIIKGKQGKRSIRTFGTPLKRVTLVQKAPGTQTYRAYSVTTVYRNNRR